MPDRLLLSRYRLSTFAACRRRFQLRYLQRLAWPAAPRALPLQMALERGEAFHRLVERYYLGLPPFAEDAGIPDEKLSLWWRAFRQSGPEMPAGKRLTEYTLTVPIGPHFLTGRFDLLVLTGDGAHIFDWKTEARPRTAAVLRDDLQTLLYLAMVTEGATALGADGPINPDHVRITYWYATDPAASVTLGYSRRQHAENWANLSAQVTALAAQIEATEAVWPLTDNLQECAICAFRAYCGRQQVVPLAATRAAVEDLEPEEDAAPPHLEPDVG
ncbi:MAG: PD-(D/E)XK nuclease family protein [Ardenticatenales bacterium]|nr:PD-(D/E)XK nuclease family protein [Ardenticatenales bacterium]